MASRGSGRSRHNPHQRPRYANSKVTEVVVTRARRAVLLNTQGATHAERVADARELFDMLGLTDPTNLLKPVEAGDSTAIGGGR